MNYAEIERQKQDLAKWLARVDWTVFGTVKFTNGHDIHERKAEADLRKFWNKLDRVYMGANLVDAGHKIERVVFKQYGESGGNLHFHFVANPKANVERFCETARCVWDETSSFTMGYENTVIERARSSENTTRYGLHEFDRLGADTLFLPATHFASPLPSANPIHKLRRLTKRHDQNEQTKEAALMRQALAGRRKRIAALAATH